jgi:hypothetical protein
MICKLCVSRLPSGDDYIASEDTQEAVGSLKQNVAWIILRKFAILLLIIND